MSPYTILVTIAAYLALLFAVAWASGRRVDNEGFFVGNRRSPWFIVALGMIAAPMSGVTFVSVPGMVATNGFAYLQMAMGFVCGYFVIAFVLMPMLYRRQIVSVYEYLDTRFGLGSYRTGAWFFFVSKLLGAAVKIYLVCLVLQMLVFEPLGVPFAVNVAATMLLVWLYTFRGGVRSLVWTDLLRAVFLLASVGSSIWFIARESGFSFGEMTTAVSDSELARVFFFDDANDRRYFFKQFFSGLFVVIAMTGLDQDMMQLPLSCRSPRDSQKNFVVSGALQFVVIAMFLCLGVLLNIYVSARGLTAPASGDELFPFAATSAGLPAVVGVVFVLGLVASTYSAAGSALTALTTSFTVDILGAGRKEVRAGDDTRNVPMGDQARFVVRSDSGAEGTYGKAQQSADGDLKLTRTRKIVHVGVAVVMAGVIFAFRALNSTSVIDAVYTLASYTYGPILGMFAFGLVSRRQVHDGFVPWVALAAPAVCLLLDLNSDAWFGGYRFGYELLILNALLTIAGLIILIKRTI